MPEKTLQFPIAEKLFLESKGNKDYERFLPCVKKIEQGLKVKEIVNPEFEDLKYGVNRFLESFFKIGISEKYLYAGKYESLPQELQYVDLPYGIHALGAMYKKQIKFEKSFPQEPIVKDLRLILDELKPLYDSFTELKTYVVKANVKKKQLKEAQEQEEEEYMKKLVSHKDAQKVIDLLNTKSKDIHEQIYTIELSFLKNIVKSYIEKTKELNKTDYHEIYSHPSYADVIMVLQSVTVREKQKTNPYIYGEEKIFSLVENYENILSSKARQHADYVVKKFIYKNTSKIAYILNEKNNMSHVSLENVNIRKGVIECDLNVKFEDKSSFIASNSVVLSYSKYGKPFYRYPTIFKNVQLPNGEKMKDVSEQTMEEIFTKFENVAVADNVTIKKIKPN